MSSSKESFRSLYHRAWYFSPLFTISINTIALVFNAIVHNYWIMPINIVGGFFFLVGKNNRDAARYSWNRFLARRFGQEHVRMVLVDASSDRFRDAEGFLRLSSIALPTTMRDEWEEANQDTFVFSERMTEVIRRAIPEAAFIELRWYINDQSAKITMTNGQMFIGPMLHANMTVWFPNAAAAVAFKLAESDNPDLVFPDFG